LIFVEFKKKHFVLNQPTTKKLEMQLLASFQQLSAHNLFWMQIVLVISSIEILGSTLLAMVQSSDFRLVIIP
jgi:hypothetical protein